MKIQCFHSSSEGNLYSISDGKTRIMLECGVDFKEIQKCFDFKLSEVAACLITHEHGDHAKSWEKVSKYTPVYMRKETAEALGAKGYNIKHYTPNEPFIIGDFNITPYSAWHDVPCCYFIIHNIATRERLIFATDTAFIPCAPYHANYAMIECNYQREILNESVDRGRLNNIARNRIVRSHFGLDKVVELLKGINPATLQEIHILHLSGRHTDAAIVKKTIEEAVGKPVYIAKE
jgi:phosphoribosyl 1,2-cyclic phosphodiesterase